MKRLFLVLLLLSLGASSVKAQSDKLAERAFHLKRQFEQILERGSMEFLPDSESADALSAALVLAPAWGPDTEHVKCPTCKGKGQLHQACIACFGNGKLACSDCLGASFLLAAESRNESVEPGSYGWPSLFRKFAVGFELDRNGHWIGPGFVHCSCYSTWGINQNCKLCKGKSKFKCITCKGKGQENCYLCKGRKTQLRACGDCLGAKVLPNPSGRIAAEIATCLWCGGSGGRTCADCSLHGGESQRVDQFREIRGKPQDNSTDFGFVERTCVPCMGQKKFDCPACIGSRKAICKICSGRAQGKCTVCKGKGRVKCKTCEQSGSTTCPYCKGKGKAKLRCVQCHGNLVRSCDGCFRGGSRQWEVNAEILEKQGLLEEALVWRLAAKQRVERHAATRMSFATAVGYDWLTGRVVSANDLADLKAERIKAAERQIARGEKLIEAAAAAAAAAGE